MSDQRAENRRRIGELAMAFMDDLEREFGDEAILRDFVVVAEIEYGDLVTSEDIAEAGSTDCDVTRRRTYIRYRSSSWRPIVLEGLVAAAAKLITTESDDG